MIKSTKSNGGKHKMANDKISSWLNPSISRRSFLKVSGTLATAAAISPVFTNTKPANAAVVSELLATGENQPDPVESAENIIYSVCQMCHSRCGVRAKVIDGVLVKIDGNPYHPNNRDVDENNIPDRLTYNTDPVGAYTEIGRMCLKGQSGIQTVYDPYRVQQPLKRVGPRNSGQWEAISWDEAFSEERGWRIGNGEEYEDHRYQDAVESQALYNVLENEVRPCFYDRKSGELPNCWLQKMKSSMKMAMGMFCSLRMVGEYEQRFYIPAAKRFETLTAHEAKEAKQLAARIKRIRSLWKHIQISSAIRQNSGPFRVGDSFQVTSEVYFGELKPDEVDVELYYGHIKSLEKLNASNVEPMTVIEDRGNGHHLYGCSLPCTLSGRFGFTVRAMPRGDDRIKSTPGLLTWA